MTTRSFVRTLAPQNCPHAGLVYLYRTLHCHGNECARASTPPMMRLVSVTDGVMAGRPQLGLSGTSPDHTSSRRQGIHSLTPVSQPLNTSSRTRRIIYFSITFVRSTQHSHHPSLPRSNYNLYASLRIHHRNELHTLTKMNIFIIITQDKSATFNLLLVILK